MIKGREVKTVNKKILILVVIIAVLLVGVVGILILQRGKEERGEEGPSTPSKPNIITEQDFTGDGTLDLKADNGIMWVQINRDAGPTPGGFIDAGGMSGQENFLGGPIFSGGMADQSDYWALKSTNVEIVENTPEKGSYKVTRVDTAGEREITKEFTVTLEASKEYAKVSYRYTNTGTSSWAFSEHPGHIHDGAFLASVQSAEHNDIDGYINGVGTIGLTSHAWWGSYTPNQAAPFFVLFRPSTGAAVTFGFTQWDHPIHQIVAYYTGASAEIHPMLEPMATAFTLKSGESSQWRALVAFHSSGYTKGVQIYQEAAK